MEKIGGGGGTDLFENISIGASVSCEPNRKGEARGTHLQRNRERSSATGDALQRLGPLGSGTTHFLILLGLGVHRPVLGFELDKRGV